MIHTRRMTLVPCTHESLRADLEGKEALGRALGAAVAESWPPDLYDADAVRWTLDRLQATEPGTESLWGYYFVWRTAAQGAVLIGVGGFKGPPAVGRIELGYSIVAEYQRQGFATEAVLGMLQFAFAREDVEEVIAETLPELVPSIGVLDKAGFRLTGAGSEEGVIRYSISRSTWAENRTALAQT